MNNDSGTLTPDQEKARDAVRKLETSADPDFRERLRHAFATGSIEPSETPRVPQPRKVFGWASIPDWLRGSLWGRFATAAAAVAIVVAVATLNRAPALEMVAASGDGAALVAGRTISMKDKVELAAALRPGVRVRVPEGASIELRSRDHLAVFLESGTEATVPGVPGRWYGRAAKAEVETGIMRIVTGPDFRGGSLSIATQVADVEVTGTTLAVICEPVGTCVCVLEGNVHMTEKGGKPVPIHQGMRRFVFNDGRPPESDKMRDTEVEKLSMFRAQVRSGL